MRAQQAVWGNGTVLLVRFVIVIEKYEDAYAFQYYFYSAKLK